MSQHTAKKSENMISAIGRTPGHRGAHRGADDRLLGDRRVADALGAELVEEALVVLNTPPAAAMSSPEQHDGSGRGRISWAMPSATASR